MTMTIKITMMATTTTDEDDDDDWFGLVWFG